MNKQFELLEFVFDPFMLTCSMMRFISLLLLGMCPCGVSVVRWSSLVCLLGCRGTLCGVMCIPRIQVVAVTVMCVMLFVLHVCMLRECEGDGNAGVGMDKVWLW